MEDNGQQSVRCTQQAPFEGLKGETRILHTAQEPAQESMQEPTSNALRRSMQQCSFGFEPMQAGPTGQQESPMAPQSARDTEQGVVAQLSSAALDLRKQDAQGGPQEAQAIGYHQQSSLSLVSSAPPMSIVS